MQKEFDVNPAKTKSTQQGIGALGEHEVATVPLSARWGPVKTETHDFGEDLIVQSFNKGRADPFRTLVQVRAKSEIKPIAGDIWSLSVPKEDLAPWLRLREAFIIVAWDEKSKSGRYAIPRENFSYDAVMSSQNNNFTIHFAGEDVWEERRLPTLAWTLRLNLYYLDRIHKLAGQSGSVSFDDAVEMRLGLGRQILNDLEFLIDDTLVDSITQRLDQAVIDRDRSMDDILLQLTSPDDQVVFEEARIVAASQISLLTQSPARSDLCDFIAMDICIRHLRRLPSIENEWDFVD